MGKVQSKRSVDITTEAKKEDVLEEGTGKLEKIEDVDQLKAQVNGDTHHNETETNDKEKIGESEGTENEKDLSTEKETQKSNPDGSGDSNVETAAAAAVAADTSNANSAETKSMENGAADETLNESKASVTAGGETTSPEGTPTTEQNTDSSKKPKKEKVKKKWSFRSLSFSKKDKPKPAKKDESTAVNGECEKVPEEPAEEQTPAADGKVEEKKTEDVAAVATEKPTQPEEAAAKTESEPVTNGTSEHPKDESSAPHQPQTPESAAATAVVTAVVEEKKPEQDQPAPPAVVANNESADQPKVESASVAAPIVVAAPEVVAKTNDLDQKQQNGAVDESPAAAPTAKIEVNAEENVSKDNDEIKDRIETQPEQKIDNEQDTIKTNDIEDGENESAQNLPPPPLPFTPPPSQVMVFALSENKSNEQEPTIIATNQPASETPAAVEPLKMEIPESVEDLPLPSPPPPPPQVEETPVLPAAPEAPAPENQQNVEVPPPSEKKSAEEPPQEQQPEAVVVESKPEEPSAVAEPEKVGGVRFEESEKPAASEIPETVPETVAKIETELNPDKIAETIALIDEVTQEAAVISQKMLDESSATSNTDTTTITSPSSHPEGNLSSPPQLPSTVEQPEPLQSPTQTESSPEQTQPTNVETQAQVAPDVIGDHVEIVSPSSNLEQESQPQQIVAAAGEVKAELIQNNQSESLDKSKDDQITVEADINKSVAVEQQQQQQDDVSSAPISKENGVAENGDDHPAETSATESLNGHAEEHNKTIEEMKAEQAEKIKTDNVAEPVAVAE